MEKKQVPKVQFRNKKLLIIVGITILIGGAIVAILLLTTPKRSVASYCKVLKEEDAKLNSANGTSYGVKVFSHKSSNAADFVNAFKKLERVAPNEIQSDVKILRQVFEKIETDPSQAIGASVSGLSAEKSVADWTKLNCQQ